MAAADRSRSWQPALVARRVGRWRETGYDIASGIHALSVHRVVGQRVLRGGVSPADRRYGGGAIVNFACCSGGRDGLPRHDHAQGERRAECPEPSVLRHG
jgi:hypothetical protein